MRTVKTTEKYDKDGKIIERITETTDTFETLPFYPWNQPIHIPSIPYLNGPNPIFTCESQTAFTTTSTAMC